MQRAHARAEEPAVEADRRGTAVSTPATDVRKLRTQVRDAGKTPAAPGEQLRCKRSNNARLVRGEARGSCFGGGRYQGAQAR